MLDRTSNPSWGVVLDAGDPHRLATFYAELLGWSIQRREPHWVTIGPADGVGYLGFQGNPDYVRPSWPARDGEQQQMLHLDLKVAALEAAVAEAVQLGATQAHYQPQDDVRVMLDPAGHPFCLYLDGIS